MCPYFYADFKNANLGGVIKTKLEIAILSQTNKVREIFTPQYF
jgi:hypothetical protein